MMSPDPSPAATDIDAAQVERIRTRLAPLPTAYLDLYDDAVRVLSDDPRVRGVWVSGSIARGSADAGSDLDFLLAVPSGDFRDFAAGWRERVEAITPVLISREMPGLPGSTYATTTDCLRLDIVVEPIDRLDHSPFRTRLVVFDRDGLTATVPAVELGAETSQQAATGIVEEAYREAAIFPAAVVARGDWLLGVVGVHQMQLALYRLLVECNQPLPPMGVKQWTRRLRADQVRILSALPQPVAERESVVAAMGAALGALRGFGRSCAEAVGLVWPAEVDAGVLAYFERENLPVGAR